MFSPPPLKFRTAGFPQYGFKLEFNRDLHHDAAKTSRFIRGQSLVRPPPIWSLRTRPPREGKLKQKFPKTIQSRGPWLASGLCCPAGSIAYYDLICSLSLRVGSL